MVHEGACDPYEKRGQEEYPRVSVQVGVPAMAGEVHNLFITGCGCSGTSALAGLFRNAGFFMGDHPPPRHRSPKRSWDDAEVNRINESILAPLLPARRVERGVVYGADSPGRGQSWLARLPLETAIRSGTQDDQDIAALVARQPFCFKDPRFCYTLDAWQAAAPEARKICIFRSPGETVASILTEIRSVPYLYDVALSVDQAFEVWRLMYQHVLGRHAHRDDWLFLFYDDLFEARTLDRVEAFTGTVVDRSFSIAPLERSGPDIETDAATRAVFEELMELARSADGTRAHHSTKALQCGPASMLLSSEIVWIDPAAGAFERIGITADIEGQQCHLYGAALLILDIEPCPRQETLSDCGISVSEKFGPFIYIQSPSHGQGLFEAEFHRPAGTTLKRMGLRLWNSDEPIRLSRLTISGLEQRERQTPAANLQSISSSTSAEDFVPSPKEFNALPTRRVLPVRINDAFNRVVVLNLESRPDRWKKMLLALERAGIRAERFAAIDGQADDVLRSYLEYQAQPTTQMPAGVPPVAGFWEIAHGLVPHQAAVAYLEAKGHKAIASAGAWGYLKSMEAVLQAAHADGVETLLVFDDDVVFHRRSAEIFSTALADLPSDWQVLLLGTMQHNWGSDSIQWRSSPFLYTSRCGAIGSHAVGLRDEVFPLLLEEIRRMDMPYDIGALSTAMRTMPNYVVYPNIAIQRLDNSISDIGTSNFLAGNSKATVAETFHWDLEDYPL